jgi:SagB-type dehydrogenase family enzyme
VRKLDIKARKRLSILLTFLLVISLVLYKIRISQNSVELPLMTNERKIKLPEPRYESNVSVEEALTMRRSIREYTSQPLLLQEVSQLLWAAQGITDPRGFRTAPSAGALYPLNLYLVVGNVVNLSEGLYKYLPETHEIVKVFDGDIKRELASAAMGQSSVENAPLDLVITAVYERTTGKYGEKGIRYVHIEVGHAAQNLCLQAAAMGLGIVTVGGFDDSEVKEVLNLSESEQPLYIIPIGRK